MAPSYHHTPTMKTSYFSPTLMAEGLGGIPSSASCGQHLDKLWTCPFLLSSLCDRAGKWNSFYLLSDKGVKTISRNIILCQHYQLEIYWDIIMNETWYLYLKSGWLVGKNAWNHLTMMFFAKYRWHLQLSAPPSVVTACLAAPWWSTWRCQIKAKLQRNHNTPAQYTIAQLAVTGR